VYLVMATAHIVWLSSDRSYWVTGWVFHSVIAVLLLKHTEVIIIVVALHDMVAYPINKQ